MKSIWVSLAVLLTGLDASLRAASVPSLPAPLPAFMDQEQLTKWNAVHASSPEATTATGFQESDSWYPFFTGKPYVAEAGGYVFKYRIYNPETTRWTTADPSGFPDGTNNRSYAPSPVNQLDPQGLTVTVVNGTANPSTATETINGGTYTVTAGPVTAQNVSSRNINTLNNLYSQSFVNGSADVTVTVTSYYATASGGQGGLYITLSAPAGYDFTQDITSGHPRNTSSGHHPPGVPYADLHNPNSAISENSDDSEGDLGGGNWFDTPGQSLTASANGEVWTANLYIEQVTGSTYTVVGRVSYSYTITE